MNWLEAIKAILRSLFSAIFRFLIFVWDLVTNKILALCRLRVVLYYWCMYKAVVLNQYVLPWCVLPKHFLFIVYLHVWSLNINNIMGDGVADPSSIPRPWAAFFFGQVTVSAEQDLFLVPLSAAIPHPGYGRNLQVPH